MTPCISKYCVYISTGVTSQVLSDTCRTFGQSVYSHAFCVLTALEHFFVPRPRYRRNPDSLISPFPSYNFLKSWHFFFLAAAVIFISLSSALKDKLWKNPKMNHEKNPFLWILLSSGDQFHLLTKDHSGIPLFWHQPVGQSGCSYYLWMPGFLWVEAHEL